MPIRTPRLLLRPKQPGDGAATAAAIAETWDDLHRWMAWAQTLQDNTAEKQEIRTREVMAKFILREELNLLGIEHTAGQPVIWCGFHSIDWNARGCDIGFWVRQSAHGYGFATEATNALLRYAFGPLGMRRVGITHSGGNDASRRVIEKLGFTPEGIQRAANLLPGGRLADRHCYARLDTLGLPDLQAQWGNSPADLTQSADDPGNPDLTSYLRALEERLLDPAIRADPEAAATLLTDDFREFGSSGRSFTKRDILRELANESPRTLHLSHFRRDPLTDSTALLTYRSHRQSASGESASALRSSFWIRGANGWQMHFHQGTREK